MKLARLSTLCVVISSLILLAAVACAPKSGNSTSATAAQKALAALPAGMDDNSPPPVIYHPDKTITVHTTSLCQFDRKLDGQWIGNTIASDGKVYFGSSSHSSDTAGMFFQYDPKTKKVIPLTTDLSITCGENAKTMVPQGKIHTPIVECDGWLYFATHLAAYWKYAYDHYTGPHVLAYKLGSLEAGKPVFRDFGVVREDFSCYAGMTADPVNKHVYVLVCRWWHGGGGYLYRYNLDGSGKKLLADLGTRGGQCFFMFPDKRGDVWYAEYGKFGSISRIDGKSGQLTTYPNALPMKLKQLKNEPKLDPNEDPMKNELSAHWGRAFLWGSKIDGDRCAFSMHFDGGVWEFDASKVKNGDANGSCRLLHWIGTHTLGLALGGDTLYFIQSGDPNWTRPEEAADHHLKCVKIFEANAPIIDLGRIVDQAGRTPYRAESFASDSRGNVYMVGDWRVKPNEIGTKVSSLSYDQDQKTDPNHQGKYYDMWRGEFFGAVTVRHP